MAELKQKAQKGLVWDLAGTFSQHGISFIISIFLARILHPHEFGLVGMAMVFILIFQIFADFGFASALIQNKNNTSLTYSSVFYINIFLGILLVALFQLAAPLIGNFYHNDKVTELIRWLSLSIFISSLNIVQRTILARNINFKTLTIRQIISQCIGGVVGIYLAFNKWGAYALVAQYLIATFADVIILWRVTEWYPKLEFSWNEVKKLTAFSSYTFLSQLFNTIISRLDVLIVGRAFSPITLGFYSRADSLNAFVTKYSSRSITRVFYSVLSKVQDDDDKFISILFSLLHIVVSISFLLTGLMVFAGPDIIILLFGNKWQPSIIIFQVLALKAFVLPTSSIIVTALNAKGKSKENFWYGNVRRGILLPAYILGYKLGFEAFLWTVVIVDYVNWLFNNFIVTKHLKIPFRNQVNTVIPYFLIFASGYLILTLLFYKVDYFLFLGIIKALIFMLYYGAVNYLLKTQSYTFIYKNGISSLEKLKNSLKRN